jgi:hypothetical protein
MGVEDKFGNEVEDKEQRSVRSRTFKRVWDRKSEVLCETKMWMRRKCYKNKIKGGRRKNKRIKLGIKTKKN